MYLTVQTAGNDPMLSCSWHVSGTIKTLNLSCNWLIASPRVVFPPIVQITMEIDELLLFYGVLLCFFFEVLDNCDSFSLGKTLLGF